MAGRSTCPDHPARTDSPEYVAARSKMNEIAGQAAGLIYGPGPFQDHHGGALWLKDAQGWFMVRNLAGIEWSAQWCADPGKVDLLRQNAKRMYDLLAPEIKQELDPDGLLDTPIQDADGIAKWTDSIFNAGVPLHPAFHTGVLPAGGVQNAAAADPEPGGVHHYPTPIADIQLFKRDDFELWVTDQEGNPAAVAPLAAARQRRRPGARAVRHARVATGCAEESGRAGRPAADPQPGAPTGPAGLPEPIGRNGDRQCNLIGKLHGNLMARRWLTRCPDSPAIISLWPLVSWRR